MKPVDDKLIAELGCQAAMSSRRRQHYNLHVGHGDPCQRLLNFLWHDSNIRPHRHAADPKEETLIALRGDMRCIRFEADGRIIDRTDLSAGGPLSGDRYRAWRMAHDRSSERIGGIARDEGRSLQPERG